MSSNMQVMELFPIPVFIIQATQLDNNRLCHLIYDIRDEEYANGTAEKTGLSNLGGFRTYDLLNRSGFEELKNFIITSINDNILKGKWYPGEEIDESHIAAMWSIINKKGHANSAHNHPDSWLSGVYYPKIPKSSNHAGALSFRDPILARTYTRDFYRSVQSEVCSIPPEEGRMILFPGWCEHSVRPNQTDEDRIAISFNVKR